MIEVRPAGGGYVTEVPINNLFKELIWSSTTDKNQFLYFLRNFLENFEGEIKDGKLSGILKCPHTIYRYEVEDLKVVILDTAHGALLQVSFKDPKLNYIIVCPTFKFALNILANEKVNENYKEDFLRTLNWWSTHHKFAEVNK